MSVSDRELVTSKQVIDKVYELRALLRLCAEDENHFELLVGGVQRVLSKPCGDHEWSYFNDGFLERLLDSGKTPLSGCIVPIDRSRPFWRCLSCEMCIGDKPDDGKCPRCGAWLYHLVPNAK